MTKPGEILLQILNDRGITPYKLSKATGLSQTLLSEVIHKDRRITAKTALFLGKALSITAIELMTWQSEYDLYLLGGSEDE